MKPVQYSRQGDLGPYLLVLTIDGGYRVIKRDAIIELWEEDWLIKIILTENHGINVDGIIADGTFLEMLLKMTEVKSENDRSF